MVFLEIHIANQQRLVFWLLSFTSVLKPLESWLEAGHSGQKFVRLLNTSSILFALHPGGPMTHPQLIDTNDISSQEPTSPESPQRSPRFHRSLSLGLLGLFLLLGGGSGYWWFTRSASKSAASATMGGPMAVPVTWQTLEPTVVEETTVLVGTLEAPEASDITSEVDGRVSQIFVKEGDRVEKGQPLASLDTDTLKAELAQAQATLEKDQAELAKLEAGTRQEEVAQAQAQVSQAQAELANAKTGASPEEIAQAKAQLDAAKATAELATSRVNRFKNLRDEGVIPLDTYDQQIKEQRQAIAEVQSAQRRLSQLQKGRRSDLNRLQAELEQERQNLARLKNGTRPEDIAQARAQVAQSQAQVTAVEVKLQKSVTTAPFSGIVGYVPAKVGNYVKAGDRLTTLTENNQIELNLSVPIDQAGKLERGQRVQVLDDQTKVLATGEISFISPNVNTDAQTVLARASFSDANRTLLNRQLVQAKILWSRGQGLVVPTVAVSRVGGATFVYVVKSSPNQKGGESQLVAEQKSVQLGTLQGNNYQILEGVEPGEKIITSGLLNLQDGVPITEAGKMPDPSAKGKK